MADRSVLVPMTLSDLERRDARGQMFPTDLCNYAHTFRHRTTTIGKVTCSGGLISRGQPRPHLKGLGLGVPQFL